MYIRKKYFIYLFYLKISKFNLSRSTSPEGICPFWSDASLAEIFQENLVHFLLDKYLIFHKHFFENNLWNGLIDSKNKFERPCRLTFDIYLFIYLFLSSSSRLFAAIFKLKKRKRKWSVRSCSKIARCNNSAINKQRFPTDLYPSWLSLRSNSATN